MTTVAAAVGVILLLLLCIFVPVVVPYILNIGVSAFIAFKLVRRPMLRILVFVGLSALMSLNVRMLTWIQGDPNEVRTKIVGKAAIDPEEKLVLDSDSQHVYFRRRTDPPRFGLRNDWSIGFVPVETVYEEPTRILSNLGIGHHTGTDGKTVLRIRTRENLGVMQVSASILVNGTPMSEYTHMVRKSYPLEEFDYYGKFKDGDWKAAFLYLTQSTLWVAHRDLVPVTYRPLREYIKAAVEQRGVSEDGTSIAPVIDGLNVLSRWAGAKATTDLTSLPAYDMPPTIGRTCKGKDAGHDFTAVPPETVIWKDEDLPRMTIPRSTVDGYLVLPSAIACDKEANRFWLGAYHLGKLNLWRYRVDFRGRSLRLERWLQAQVSQEARQAFDELRPRGLRIGAIHESSADLYVFKAVNDRWGRPVADHGYRVQMALK
jgi:hypothetical protein